MLSTKIFSSSDAAGKYYSHGDYYGNEGEGLWFGDGAKDFGLEGKFTAKNNKQFYNLLEGITPTGEKIGRKTKEGIEHCPGVDLTFSVPKSFSLQMMLYANGDERRSMEVAVMNAVKSTLSYVEKEGYVYARIGHNGKTRENLTKLTFASFMHTTNRNVEPQVHVHSFLANIAKCSDGKYRSINLDKLLENNKLFGQMFRNELALETKKLGHEITPTVLSDSNTSFELINIHPKMIEAFSTRRKEILELCKEYGITTKKGRDKIVINSRKAKQQISQEQLTKAWSELEQKVQMEIESESKVQNEIEKDQQLPERHNEEPAWQATWLSKIKNFVTSFGSNINNQDQSTNSNDFSAKDLVKIAIEDISYSKSVFSKSDLLKNTLKYSIGQFGSSATVSDINAEIKKLEKEGYLIKDKNNKYKDLLTTKELLNKEKQILKFTQNSIGTSKVMIKPDGVDYQSQKFEAREFAKNKNFKMNGSQRKAIDHILTSEDKIVTMEGLPGVGKSTVLNAVRDISGRKVINLIGSPFGLGEKFTGSAPTASAAKTLKESAGVESQTLHSFLGKYQGYIEGRGSKNLLKHFKQEYKNTIIFVDEASLISTNIMHKLLTLQEKFGFRLVMTGDTKQLGSVEAGKPFEQILEIIKPVKLKEIVRQKDQTHKEAVTAASDGKIADTFSIHDKNIKTSASIAEDAANNYLGKSQNQRENTLLISPTRALRDEINNKIVQGFNISSAKHEFTALRSKDMSKADLNFAHFYSSGDVIRFNTNYTGLGINKDDYLKVKAVNKITNSLILDKCDQSDNNSKKDKNIVFNLKPKTDYSNKLEVFQEKQLQLQEGLKIIFTKNNRELGLINSETATIDKISTNIVPGSHEKVTLKFENGTAGSIPVDQLKHIDYGYCVTVHAAQGKTYNTTIAAINNNKLLNNQKMWLVAISRHRSDFTALVENKEKLQNQLSKKEGRENSAISIAYYQSSSQNSSVNNLNPTKQISKQKNINAKSIREIEIG